MSIMPIFFLMYHMVYGTLIRMSMKKYHTYINIINAYRDKAYLAGKFSYTTNFRESILTGLKAERSIINFNICLKSLS